MARQRRTRKRQAWRPGEGGIPLPSGRRRPPPEAKEKEAARKQAPFLGGRIPWGLRPHVMRYLNTQERRMLQWAEEERLRVPSAEELARAETETAEVEEEEALCAALVRLELGDTGLPDEPLFAAQTPREEIIRREAACVEPSEDSWGSRGSTSPRGSPR